MSTPTLKHILPYLGKDYYYDEKAAQRPITFIENFLVLFDSQFAGQAMKLMEWQRQLIQKTYGIKRKENDKRRFRTVYCLIPRKNSKSTTIAALLLYELVCGNSFSSQNLLASNSREQASILLNIMKGFIQSSPYLSKILEVHKNQITHKKTNSFIKTVSREGSTVYGSNPKVFCYDEITFAPASDLYDSLSTGQGAQHEPLAFLIGTASPSKSNWGYTLYEYAKKIHDNPSINEAFLSIIYGASDDDDWKSEETWYKCNPSLGTTITLDYLKQEFIKTKEFPSYEASFRLFYLNQFVDADNTWIPSELWEECVEDIYMEEFKGQPCWIGLDLSTVNDTTALVTVFEREGTFYAFPKAFVPANVVENKERKHKVPYRSWVNGGHLTETLGNQGMVVDYQAIVDYIDELREQYDVQSIYFDPWNSTSMINLLENNHMDVLVQMRQGYKTLSPLTKETEKLITSKRLKHPNNPVFNWHIQNVVLEMDAAGNCKPSKKKSANKIDLAVACIMAVGGASADLYLDEGDAEVLFL
jgi:phage terminase large subunit-like protein